MEGCRLNAEAAKVRAEDRREDSLPASAKNLSILCVKLYFPSGPRSTRPYQV